MTKRHSCDACGGLFGGGREECQSVFDASNALASGDVAYGRVHRLLVDSYCLQHLEPYCRSAKSYAAHLTGLCWGMQHGGGPDGYAAIQRWLNGAITLMKPPVLDSLGTLTLADVRTATSPAEHESRVRLWASDVWATYRSQHDLAEHWLALALDSAHPKRAARRR